MIGYGNSMFLATHGILARSGSTPAFTGLLDTYPNAAVAYSFRKLRTAYSENCIRVRRSSDNTEQDFGFVNNVLDTASLLTFCGAGNGFVTTWYDQSGNANNITQATATRQPRIVNAGALETSNGKTSMRFLSASTMLLQKTSYTTIDFKNTAVATVISDALSATNQNPFSLNTNPRWYTPYITPTNTYYGYGATATTILSEATDNNQRLYFMNANSTTLSAFTNNITKSTVSSVVGNSSNIQIGAGGATNYYNGKIQEAIDWASEQSSNRTGIQNNINTYYSIY
jgi:hypothetical protein